MAPHEVVFVLCAPVWVTTLSMRAVERDTLVMRPVRAKHQRRPDLPWHAFPRTGDKRFGGWSC
jgi:hypothetical protein